MAKQYKIGDLVRLKSGGPVMTVIQVSEKSDERPVVLCNWFTEPVKKQASFPPETVIPLAEEPTEPEAYEQ